MKNLLIVLTASLFLHSVPAHAFPEMIRHSYFNCTSCHTSPNGGGVLNEYGRQSAQAVLSTWGTENEAKPFYNLFEQPKWIDTGIFGRAIQTAQNNSSVSKGYFWIMQAEAEAAAKLGSKLTLDLDLGLKPDVLNSLAIPGASPVIARRFFAMYRPTETTSIRAGKFMPDYGVYFSEHSISTRQGLGFGEDQETYNVEYGYQGENYAGSLTLNLGRPDHASSSNEKGGVANASMYLSDKYKLGWSAYYGTVNGSSRELTGPYALLGFSTRFYLLAEADLQFTQPAIGSSTQGLFTYSRLGYELIQGLHLYLMEQSQTRLFGVGPGVVWFPRPHFYFKMEVQQQYSKDLPSPQSSGFLTANVYL